MIDARISSAFILVSIMLNLNIFSNQNMQAHSMNATNLELPPGKFGKALEMKGFIESYMTIPGHLTIDPQVFSVSFWIKVEPAAYNFHDTAIISHVNQSNTAGWFFDLRTKPQLHIDFSVVNSKGLAHVVSVPIQPGRFDNIVGVFDGIFLKIYLNGVLLADTIFTGRYEPRPDIPLILVLSSYRQSGDTTVLIDELGFYGKPLSKAEIITLFNNAQKPSGIGGLIGYWPFDNGTIDVSGNHNDGSLDKHPIITLDADGVPLVDYGQVNGTYIGQQRNPITASLTGLKAHTQFMEEGNETAKEQLLHNADWLVSNADSRGNYSVFEYEFPWPPYNLHPKWVSGMAHGLAIELLVHANQITNRDIYLETAKSLLNSFFVDVKDGGVTHKDSDSEWWYEEYAQNSGNSPRVLNGMMYTLLGIYEYYNYTKDKSAKDLFDKGIASLVTNLPKYDEPKYSYSFYDILKTTNPIFYHNVHIDLLNQLYVITGNEVLKHYHDRWEKFTPPPYT